MRKSEPLIVVSQKGDLPQSAGRVVTADEFLAGDVDLVVEGLQVVNLCRSWRHLSKGYYVSLLADARGQQVVPSVDTLRGLESMDDVLRTLQEAGVATLDAAELKGRRGAVLAELADEEDDGVPLVREPSSTAVVYRLAEPSELAEATVYMGACPDKRFRRATSIIYRLWPVPVLRVKFLRENDRWNVTSVAPVLFGKLTPEEQHEVIKAAASRGTTIEQAPPPEKELSIAVLFDENDPHKPSSEETIERLARVAAPMGVHVQRIDLGDLSHVGEYDALFIRTLTGIDLPSFRFVLLAEQLGMPVIDDSRSIIRCTNKVFLHELFVRHDIPQPPTLTVTRDMSFASIRRELGLPFILKLPSGAFSTAVFKIVDKKTYDQRSGELFKQSPLLVAQGYLPTPYDWRVAVLDGKPLFVCRYHMARGHWQITAPTSRGPRFGRVEAVPRKNAPRKVVSLAARAAKLIGTGLYGVDLKESPKGPVVIEVNDNPNIDLDCEDQCEGDAIYRELVQHFVSRLKAPKKAPPARSHQARTPTPQSDVEALRAPIGKLPREVERAYRPFEVCGLEVEYCIVDSDLQVAHLAPHVLSTLAGRAASDVTMGVVGISNEIMDHVIELKTEVPLRSLVETERALVEGVKRVTAVLGQRHDDARLMPTAMHPWFDPRRAQLWTRSNTRIYNTYARLFDVKTHGWSNVQACHINLPAGDDEHAVHLMNAASLLVPYLPALAAASPVFDGTPGPAIDNRLLFILEHQARVPESTGRVVPEPIWSMAQYRQEVIAPMFRALDALPDARPLRQEFFNARGAVFKLSRQSMEVRVVDMQECIKMDVAIAAFVRGALQALVKRLVQEETPLPDHDVLVEDFEACVRNGTSARVKAPHLTRGLKPGRGGTVDVKAVLYSLIGLATDELRAEEAAYLEMVTQRVDRGNLSERMLHSLRGTKTESAFEAKLRRLYQRMADCLVQNEPFDGSL